MCQIRSTQPKKIGGNDHASQKMSCIHKYRIALSSPSSLIHFLSRRDIYISPPWGSDRETGTSIPYVYTSKQASQGRDSTLLIRDRATPLLAPLLPSFLCLSHRNSFFLRLERKRKRSPPGQNLPEQQQPKEKAPYAETRRRQRRRQRVTESQVEERDGAV